MDINANSIRIRGSFCIEEIPKPAGVIIFGASGDLTSRKLIPSLFNLFSKTLLPTSFYIVGVARSSFTDDQFREKMAEAIKDRFPAASDESVKSFLSHCFYVAGDYRDEALYRDLIARIYQLDKQCKPERNHIFYLATPPSVYKDIISHLGESKLTREASLEHVIEARVIIEKPFGHDLESAMDLDSTLRGVLSERQIYRIDHYLGKETVQNILLFRFANSIFEPIWNRRYIDNIQITVSERVGVEHRAGYFEQAGLLRDMFQNHMLQMLSIVTMEPPISFDANRVRDEKVKLLRAIRPIPTEKLSERVIRAQYESGKTEDKTVPGYRDERGVAPESRVETFVAAKILIENWRWQGVPIYLRAGKRMNRKASKIVVTFKNVPHSMFFPLTPEDLNPNVLIFHVQPEEGISLGIQAKHPGPKLCMDALEMNFQYSDVYEGELPEAYERLLLDCMLGDQTLFIRHDDMEVSWSLITPILRAWEDDRDGSKTGALHAYPAGSWGPSASELLLQRDGRMWIRV
jgi:glucose-6-phosphate 1-dehydrogenase